MSAVSYRVGSADPRTHLLDVEMTIAQPKAQQRLSLPVWIPGSYMVREFSRHFQDLQARQGRRLSRVRAWRKGRVGQQQTGPERQDTTNGHAYSPEESRMAVLTPTCDATSTNARPDQAFGVDGVLGHAYHEHAYYHLRTPP